MFWNFSAGAIGIRNVSLAETLLLAKSGGFHGVDFSITEVAVLVGARGVEYVRSLFTSAGLRPGQWGLPFDWHDDAKYAAGLAELPKLAALGAELGCTRCATWVPSWSDERDFDANYDWHVARFRPIAEALKAHGVHLGLEFLGPQTLRRGHKYEFIHTLDGLLGLAGAIGTGNVGLLLDVWHHYTAGGDMAEIGRLRREQVVTVHLSDAPAGIALADHMDQVRLLPGESGVIPVAEFISALASIGYDGPLTVEPFSKRVSGLPPFAAVRETAAALDKVVPVGRLA